MSTQDRLAEIKALDFRLASIAEVREAFDWLVGEVEHLREQSDELATELANERTLHQQTLAELERLRGVLRQDLPGEHVTGERKASRRGLVTMNPPPVQPSGRVGPPVDYDG